MEKGEDLVYMELLAVWIIVALVDCVDDLQEPWGGGGGGEWQSGKVLTQHTLGIATPPCIVGCVV